MPWLHALPLLLLQAVLRSRSFERRQRQRLEAITRELAKAQQQRELAKLDRAMPWARCRRNCAGMTAVEMQFELACDRARVRQIAAMNDRLVKLEDLRRRQLEVFRKAQQQRKILENLRERQFAAYRLVQSRREQQQMDDRFLITHAAQTSTFLAAVPRVCHDSYHELPVVREPFRL